MLATVDRRARLDEAIETMAADSEYAPVVTRLACLRGVSTLTAFGLAVEIGDWQRLTGRSIGAYLGLVPTEHSSGSMRSQGSITKTGNGRARRLLIEAAWHHRPRYLPGVTLRRRWDKASPAARARGQQANRRLHDRWVGFDVRRKRPAVANTAIARELAGWCWSLAVLETWKKPIPRWRVRSASVVLDPSGGKVGSPRFAAGTPPCPRSLVDDREARTGSGPSPEPQPYRSPDTWAAGRRSSSTSDRPTPASSSVTK